MFGTSCVGHCSANNDNNKYQTGQSDNNDYNYADRSYESVEYCRSEGCRPRNYDRAYGYKPIFSGQHRGYRRLLGI